MIDNNSIMNKNSHTVLKLVETMELLQKMITEMLGAFTQQELSKLIPEIVQSDVSKIKNGKFKDVSHSKGEAIKSFYFSWKQQKTSSVQG